MRRAFSSCAAVPIAADELTVDCSNIEAVERRGCESNDALEAVALAPALLRLDAAKNGRPTVPILAVKSDNTSNVYARSKGYEELSELFSPRGVISLLVLYQWNLLIL